MVDVQYAVLSSVTCMKRWMSYLLSDGLAGGWLVWRYFEGLAMLSYSTWVG